MTDIQILRHYKNTLIEFMDELIDMFPTEGDLVIIRFFLNDQVPIEDVVKHTYTHLVPLKPLIQERNDKFFLENQVLYQEINNNDRVNHFKRIWESESISKEDREVMWRWFELLVALAEKYHQVCNK